jgi:hypothetical protein
MDKEKILQRVQSVIDMVNYELKLQDIHVKDTSVIKSGEQMNLLLIMYSQKFINMNKINEVLRRAKASNLFSEISVRINQETKLLLLNFGLTKSR